MSADDWYRRTTWSEADADAFRVKLSRARGQRPEYLRIQAWTLADTGSPEVADPAIELARQYLDENPEALFRAEAYSTIARAFETKGDRAAALDAYREAVEADKLQPHVRSCAALDLAWFVTTNDLRAAFDEALTAMEVSINEQDLVLPMPRYRYFGALALIARAEGDVELASSLARRALDASRKSEGPYHRHPQVGVVKGIDPDVARRIEQLAGQRAP